MNESERPAWPVQERPRRGGAWLAGLLGGLAGGALVWAIAVAGWLPGGAPGVGGLAGDPAVSHQTVYVDVHTAVGAIAEQAGQAVVGLTNYAQDRRGRWVEQGTGSGVIIDSRGVIVTNHHVVAGAAVLAVSLADGRSVEGQVVGSDPFSDLAVVRLRDVGEGLPTIPWGDSNAVKVGDLAVAIGNPMGEELERTVTAGIISGINRLVRINQDITILALQTDAAINPGNSGGALVGAGGHLIGINSAKVGSQGIEGIGFAIPANTARQIADEILRTGRYNRPVLGIRYETRDRALYFYGIRFREGLLVVQAVPEGPAARAGVREGDVIVQVGSQRIQSPGDYRLALQGRRAGEQIEVRVVRDGRELALQVTLAEAQP